MQEFKNFEILSSTSIKKLNKKKPKKYQNFNVNEGSVSGVKDEKKSINSAGRNEILEKNSPCCIDLKDFPELKASGKNQKLSFENNSTEFTNNQQWFQVVSHRNKKKSNVAFPSLPGTENLNTDKVTTDIKKEVVPQVVSEKSLVGSASITTGKKNQTSKNQKEKKINSQKPVQQQRNPNKKKRSDPVFINLQDVIVVNKHQKKGKKENIQGSKIQKRKEKELLSGNILDSANPIRSRGKHREIKKKKLSNFKITIIKERILKSKLRESGVASQFSSKSVNLLDAIDFNTEIKLYLNQLNEKKLQILNNRKKNLEKNEKKNNNQGEENLNSKSVIKKEENLVCKDKQIPQITSEGEIKFSSKFKEYCDNIITPDLNSAVIKLIEELIKLQDRLFSRDPIKAKAKRRHVSGLREVRKFLTLKKVKLILIAPNLEKLQMEGSVYDSINELKSLADSQNVPYGFVLDRYKLGRCTKKNTAVSAFAVLNYEGLEALYENVLQQLSECKAKFSEFKKPKIEENTDDVNSKVLSSLVTAFQDALKLAVKAESPEE